MSEENTQPSFDETVASIADTLDENLMIDGHQELETKKSETTEEPPVEEASDEDYLADIDEDEVEDDATPEEDSEAEEEEESKEGDDTEVAVVVDGEELTVTMDELKKGYSRHSDYTKKTQALAEERKQVEEDAKAVNWAKETPERQALLAEIEIAQKAITTGIHYDADGKPITLTKQNIEDTQANLAEAMEKLNTQAPPPKLDVLQEKVPEMFSGDKAVQQAIVNDMGAVLRDVGFTEHEIKATNDPRTLLLLKEIIDGRELAAKVEKAKARKQSPKGVVSKSTKASKKASPQSKPRQADETSDKAFEEVMNGNMDSLGDAFLDLV